MSRNIFSNEALADWLAKQPADGQYDYGDTDNCVLCQYLKGAGLEVYSLGPYFWTDGNGKKHILPEGWGVDVALGPLGPDRGRSADQYDWTYGGALKRLRELMKEAA